MAVNVLVEMLEKNITWK